MRGFLIFAAAATVGTATAQCGGQDFAACLEAPITTTCADLNCACSQVSIETACYKKYCPEIPLPTSVLSAYDVVCGNGGNGAGGSTPATVTDDVGPSQSATNVAVTSSSPAAATVASTEGKTPTSGGPGTTSPTTAASSVAATATNAAAFLGFTFPMGGVMAAALGVGVYL